MSNPAPAYAPAARFLHWAMALLLPALLALGFYMKDLPFSPQKLQLYSWHKWAGVTAFLLLVIRVAWRATHPPEPLPATIPLAARRIAGAAHFLLYALMLSIPLSGWLMSSAKGFQTVWFGVLPIPDLLGKNPELGELLAGVHLGLNLTLVLTLLAHVGAAVKHALIDRDQVLARMLPAQP